MVFDLSRELTESTEFFSSSVRSVNECGDEMEHRRANGFTLNVLMIVVAIIDILALVAPQAYLECIVYARVQVCGFGVDR